MAAKRFDLDDQLAFARISGDSNPLHVDPLAARRLLFGEPVVHGVHVVLWALDNLVSPGEPQRLDLLHAEFDNPVIVGSEVELSAEDKGEVTAFTIRCQGKVAVRGQLRLVNGPWPNGAPSTGVPLATLVERSAAGIDGASGTIPLHWPAEGTARFPRLAAALPAAELAAIAATTRLVGMECPGRHSLFSSLRLSAGGTERDALSWSVRAFDDRFNRAEMEVGGGGLLGQVHAFLRPAPVGQPPLEALRGLVEPGEFAHVNALVVGGTRGIGECTAKLLAAGGAEVTISYASGADEAERIVGEITAAGASARAVCYDVLQAAPPPPPAKPYTHLYFFASPRIVAFKGPFRMGAFMNFARFYAQGMVECLEWFRQQAVADFVVFYPSTTFLDRAEANFVEYSAAKAAGEAVCADAALRYRKARFFHPRLPKLRTDQTQSLLGPGGQACEEVMLPLLRQTAERAG